MNLKFLSAFGILLVLTLPGVLAQSNFLINETNITALTLVQNSTAAALQQSIVLPLWLSILNEFVFNLENTANGIPLGKFVVLIILWIFLFSFSLEILQFTAFESKWVRVVIGLCVTLLISMVGLLRNVVELLFGASSFILSWKGGLVLIGIVIIYFILSAVLDGVYKQQHLIELKGKGLMAGVALKGLADTAEAMAKDVK